MRVTILGHAGLWIESSDQRILVDPVLDNNLAGGTVTYAPRRVLDERHLPEPTLLVITHGHFDHFHPPSMQRLRDRFSRVPVVTSADDELLADLTAIGFEDVTVLEPWEELPVGKTRL